MEVFEFVLYLKGKEEDMAKIDAAGIPVSAPYVKLWGRKNYPETKVDIVAYHQYGFIKLIVSQENPNGDVRGYDDLASYNLVQMFEETDIENLVERIGLEPMYLTFKVRKDYIPKLMITGKWQEDIPNLHYVYGEASMHKLDVVRKTDWEFCDNEPGDFKDYLNNLRTLGFPIELEDEAAEVDHEAADESLRLAAAMVLNQMEANVDRQPKEKTFFQKLKGFFKGEF